MGVLSHHAAVPRPHTGFARDLPLDTWIADLHRAGCTRLGYFLKSSQYSIAKTAALLFYGLLGLCMTIWGMQQEQQATDFAAHVHYVDGQVISRRVAIADSMNQRVTYRIGYWYSVSDTTGGWLGLADTIRDYFTRRHEQIISYRAYQDVAIGDRVTVQVSGSTVTLGDEYLGYGSVVNRQMAIAFGVVSVIAALCFMLPSLAHMRYEYRFARRAVLLYGYVVSCQAAIDDWRDRVSDRMIGQVNLVREILVRGQFNTPSGGAVRAEVECILLDRAETAPTLRTRVAALYDGQEARML